MIKAVFCHTMATTPSSAGAHALWCFCEPASIDVGSAWFCVVSLMPRPLHNPLQLVDTTQHTRPMLTHQEIYLSTSCYQLVIPGGSACEFGNQITRPVYICFK
jgi:hypothetical protein